MSDDAADGFDDEVTDRHVVIDAGGDSSDDGFVILFLLLVAVVAIVLLLVLGLFVLPFVLVVLPFVGPFIPLGLVVWWWRRRRCRKLEVPRDPDDARLPDDARPPSEGADASEKPEKREALRVGEDRRGWVLGRDFDQQLAVLERCQVALAERAPLIDQKLSTVRLRIAEYREKGGRENLVLQQSENERRLLQMKEQSARSASATWKMRALLSLRKELAVASRSIPKLPGVPEGMSDKEALVSAKADCHAAAKRLVSYAKSLGRQVNGLEQVVPAEPEETPVGRSTRQFVDDEVERARAELLRMADSCELRADELTTLADSYDTLLVGASDKEFAASVRDVGRVLGEIDDAGAAFTDFAEAFAVGYEERFDEARLGELESKLGSLEEATLDADRKVEAYVEMANLLGG